VILAVAAALVVVGVVLLLRRHSTPQQAEGCTVTATTGYYSLDLAQAANAAVIAAVGSRAGLADHAVSIALATALQESKLHNVPYGDRDSVGLFQQRPSQGWGPRTSLLDPHFAAAAFYAHLAKVPGWQTRSVADAAQAVQRSAAGSAYADWEPEARAIAQALTGQIPKGISCYYGRPTASSHGLVSALARDEGAGATGTLLPVQKGWRVASWLVAQAAQYDVASVSYAGERWTRASGAWQPHPGSRVVGYTLGRP
jgi:hypothetical protein